MNPLGFDKKPQDTRVVVAMSGGVDSSVTAAMLADQGYQVIGVTLQLYDYGQVMQKKGACCAGQDIYDAHMVAERIGFPHYVLDYESRFRQEVIDDFADSYLRGETPIPCVKCNQTVKFRDLLQTARDLGGDCIATGHYVQRVMGVHGAELHRALDKSKDQSYFLFGTTKEQLDYLRFPLGGMEKSQTRELAVKYGLKVADKPDSQDICFVPSGKYADLVTKLRPKAADPGKIVHVNGTVMGDHQGIIHYTVGQRRGLGIGGTEDPLYVVKIDAEAKQVVVGPKEALAKPGLVATELNWLGHEKIPASGVKVTVKIRSMTEPVSAIVYARSDQKADVVFDQAQYGVAPGQAAVFFDRDRVLGGGWISHEDVNSSQFAA